MTIKMYCLMCYIVRLCIKCFPTVPLWVSPMLLKGRWICEDMELFSATKETMTNADRVYKYLQYMRMLDQQARS